MVGKRLHRLCSHGAHPLGALYDKHHGLLNAILLPYVLQYNRPAIEDRVVHIARVIDLEDQTFVGFMHWVQQLRNTLHIPDNLQLIGIDTEQSRRVGEMAAVDPSAAGNPLSLSAEQYAKIFETAVHGLFEGKKI